MFPAKLPKITADEGVKNMLDKMLRQKTSDIGFRKPQIEFPAPAGGPFATTY
jgi:hypothetical protein